MKDDRDVNQILNEFRIEQSFLRPYIPDATDNPATGVSASNPGNSKELDTEEDDKKDHIWSDEIPAKEFDDDDEVTHDEIED